MRDEFEKWTNLAGIAEHLGVSKDTIRNYIKRGIIPHHRIGRQYIFRVSDVNAWIESGESAAT